MCNFAKSKYLENPSYYDAIGYYEKIMKIRKKYLDNDEDKLNMADLNY